MPIPQLSKLKLPTIDSVKMENFSLFLSEPTIEVDMIEGVFCLAGANGLGKSTFLASTNYALTGIVSDPKRGFDSVDEYYKYNIKYASSFFSGRISESDRDLAQITIAFHIGEYSYCITRGMFEPESLRRFKLLENSNGTSISVINTDNMSGEELNEAYCQQITTHSGLANFQQFVFLQHFVFTFDESRRLLFWDQKVLEQALHLCFGLDYNDAQRADTLRREAEKAGSLARNSNWQASEIRKKIKSLRDEIRTSENDLDSEIQDIENEHKNLLEKSDQIEKGIHDRKDMIKDNSLQINELSAQNLSLRNQYSDAFSDHLQSNFHVSQNPIVIKAVKENHCSICGSDTQGISNNIQKIIHQSICPFCKGKLRKSTNEDSSLTELKKIDKQLLKVTKKIEEFTKANERLGVEINNLQIQYNTILSELSEFEEKNESILKSLKNDSEVFEGVESVLKSYKDQLDNFLGKKEYYYKKRNEKLAELGKIKKKLEQQYGYAEAEFVPLFQTLSNLFLGLQLDVRLVSKGNQSLNLVVDVDGTSRREFYQLSESQRFFIDIALRMALARFVSSEGAKATLFIDTPEGSLDIAYESRAGKMLANFVKTGHSIIMTANINTSKLLYSLAKECTSTRMQIVRMTEWAVLSEVQTAEVDLFEQAFSEIEDALQQ